MTVQPSEQVVPFEQVVEEHGLVVLRVCRAILDPVDADDAWSETFLAALEAYPRLRPGSNVRAWLVTIAHRKAIDRHRSAARNPVPTATVPEPGVGHEEPAGDDALWEAVRTLPPKQRAAVAYRYVADLPYREIGALMGISETAARRNAADGVAALRTTWRPSDEGQEGSDQPRPARSGSRRR
ncbi:sigma-70 family RNA polymerase sigma factor [Actinopolymorpha sp. B17G11]|uniref:RNA polymerase sigma factor n=1 Tax=Actinopolymorpha sp. B17G11 TaxID=3160861 RepID=UPI0032E3B2AC